MLPENCVLNLFHMYFLWPRNGWVYIVLHVQVNFIPALNYSLPSLPVDFCVKDTAIIYCQ